jgi:hypothetical protein
MGLGEALDAGGLWSMKAKIFVIVVGVLMLIGIMLLRSRSIKEPLPISPGAFDETEKSKSR